MMEQTSWVSKCSSGIKSFLSLKVAKDFKMPVGLTVAAIALSAVSSGLSLAFIPTIAGAVASALEKRKLKQKEILKMPEKERNELLIELARKIEQEMMTNEALRKDISRALGDAMKSKEFEEYLKQNQQLATAIHDKISLLVEEFPELKEDVESILTLVKEDTKSIKEMLKMIRQINIQGMRIEQQYAKHSEQMNKILEKIGIPTTIEKDKKLELSEESEEIADAVESKVEEATKHFEKPVGDAETYLRLGNRAYFNKLYEPAIGYYDKALSINPEFAVAWYSKGLALQRLGKDSEAKKCFRRAKELGLDV